MQTAEYSPSDRLLRTGAFMAVMAMAATLIGLGWTLYRPQMADTHEVPAVTGAVSTQLAASAANKE